MDTMLIKLTNPKATRFLHDLEELQLIRIVKRSVEPVKTKLSDKYRGILTCEQGLDLKRHLNEMRNEWDSI